MLVAPGALVALVALAGCSGGDAGSDQRDPVPQIPGTPRSTPAVGTATEIAGEASPTPFFRPTSVSNPTETPVPEPVAAALERVVEARKVDRADIVVLTFTEKTWSSTALGCPEPGRSYAQIVTSGYEIILSIAGDLAIYHVDENGAAIVECEGDARD